MKAFKIKNSEEGAMLVGVLIMAAITSTVLVAVVTMIAQEHRTLARSATWNAALPMAEAGLEEAMSHMRQVGLGNRVANGWALSGTNIVLTRNRTDGLYSVSITPESPPVVTTTGMVWCASANQYIERRIEANTKGISMFMNALSAKQKIVMAGTASVDSFDSTDPNYSTNGMYTADRRKARGDVATNENTENAIDLQGTATIYGKVATGPAATVKLSSPSNVKVGSIAHVNGGGTGIQSGYYTKDMNVAFPSVEEPYVWGYNSLGFASTLTPLLLGGTNYDAHFPSGDYSLDSINISSAKHWLISGTVQIYVTSGTTIEGKITIMDGARLNIFVKSGNVAVKGNGARNETGYAGNFGIWGMPSVTNVKFEGEGSFVGTVYAPQAKLYLAGNGTGREVTGAMVANSVEAGGNYKLHYDEALQNTGLRNLTVVSWKEI